MVEKDCRFFASVQTVLMRTPSPQSKTKCHEGEQKDNNQVEFSSQHIRDTFRINSKTTVCSHVT